MSRAYRIRVKESMQRVLRAQDRVTTQLEILEILPCEQMAELVRQELEQRGFKEKDGKLIRKQKGVTVTVDPETGGVEAQAEATQNVKLETEKEGWAYDDVGPGGRRTREALRDQARKELERKAESQEGRLQTQATDRLEAELGGLRQELDQAVNRATAEALKRKAAQLGQIKEMTEDAQTGSLTIVLEV